MKILNVARSYLLTDDPVACYCVALNRELAKRDKISVGQVALVGFDDFARRQAQPRPLLALGARWVQPDLRTFVFPIRFQQAGPGSPDLDSDAAVRVFGRSFSKLLSAWRPHIVHVHGPVSAVHREAVARARRSGCRVVLTRHSFAGEQCVGLDVQADPGEGVDLLCIPWPAPETVPSGSVVVLPPSVDLSFWQPSFVPDWERNYWRPVASQAGSIAGLVACFLPPSDDDRVQKTLRGLAAGIHRLRLCGIAASVFLVDDSRSRPWHPDHSRASLLDLLPVACAVETVSAASRRTVRSLLSVADAAVFPGRFPVGSCTPLEAMAMGCPAIVAADGFGRAPVAGASGLVYEPEATSGLANSIVRLLRSPSLSDHDVRQVSQAAAAHSFASLAEDHLEIYGRLLKKEPASGHQVRPPRRRSRRRLTAAANHTAPSWIERTTLALDLDGTLITPWQEGRRPTAFPLLSSGRVSLECEDGKTYLVRAGLNDLSAILDLPWHSRIVWSTASQDKVDEITSKIVVGDATLAERTEACVGVELLHLFAASRDIILRSYSSPTVTNLRGRRVVAKPSQFLLLNELSNIGAALRSGKRKLATELATTSSVRQGFGLMIDDQPYFSPELSSVDCYRVIPFTSTDKYNNFFSNVAAPSVRQFELLDHIWRSGASPFAYLHWVLTDLRDQSDVTKELNVEVQLIEASRHTNNQRQFLWLRDRALASASYGRYCARRPRKRRMAERSRIREHVKIYRVLTRQILLEDLSRNWLVLMLGRDMDYAFEFFKTLYRDAAGSGKVALLPLSRTSIETSAPQVVSQLILDRLPGLCAPESRGLKIYDIGFHGHVPLFIKKALMPSLPGKEIQAYLFNACRCNKSAFGSCMGKRLVFRDARGRFHVGRTLGLSIERCPHTMGTLRKITMDCGRFVFEHSAVSEKEKERATELLAFVRELAERAAVRHGERLRDSHHKQ